MKHVHYWKLDESGHGVCRCGSERDFDGGVAEKGTWASRAGGKSIEERIAERLVYGQRQIADSLFG